MPPGKWPDAVAVIGDAGICSGVLVAPDVVLTAGHCADIRPTTVIAGTDLSTGARVPVAKTTAYPGWEYTYDVSVVQLATPLDVAPRALAASCTHVADAMAVDIVGFGLTQPDGHGTNSQLNEVFAIVTDAVCMSPGCKPAIQPGGELIAGGNGQDSCFGDSGGPIYLDTPRGTFAVGVVSRGLPNESEPCGDGGIYVRTDRIASWVAEVTGEDIAIDPCDPASPDTTGGCNAGGTRDGLLIGLGVYLTLKRRAASGVRPDVGRAVR